MKNISFMAVFAAFLLAGCKQDAEVKFAGEEGAKVTFSRMNIMKRVGQ